MADTYGLVLVKRDLDAFYGGDVEPSVTATVNPFKVQTLYFENGRLERDS